MSTEILPGKLSANRTVDAESTVVIEKKKEKRLRRGTLFLLAIGLGAVALASITLLAPVAFYGRVTSPGGIDDNSGSSGDGAAVIPTVLGASATAIDGKGIVIEANAVTESGEIIMTGYSDSSYSTELRCSIDSLPTYCSGGPVTISGLPTGEHVFTIAEPVRDELSVHSFSWEISG
ncbi:MAG: hypothetical protein M3261_01770 [Thermoproteota archaeon]|nr:hypothetical protein [Thermoproteota archaeon]